MVHRVLVADKVIKACKVRRATVEQPVHRAHVVVRATEVHKVLKVTAEPQAHRVQ